MPQFGLLENDELQRLLATYGTKASEKELTKRLDEGAKQQPIESLLRALVGKQETGQGTTPQQQPKPEQPEPGSFWRKLGTALMMGGAGLQGQDPSAVLKNLMAAQQAPMIMQREQRLQRQEGRLQERLGVEKSAEQRRGQQFQIRNLQYFGASVTPEMLQDNPILNSVITPLVKKFGITPEVNSDTNEITFEIPMQAELQQKALLGGKIEEKELASMAEKLPNLDRAEDAIAQLKQSFNEGWQPESIDEGEFIGGIFERLRGIGAIPLESWSQTNPQLHTYLSNVGAFSSLISKGGFLEAGVLTNQDIQRVIQALPKPGYSKERAALAWKTIDGVIGSARKRFEEKKKEYGVKGQQSTNKSYKNLWE